MRRSLLALVLTSSLVLSCESAPPEPEPDLRQDLARARERWEAAGITTYSVHQTLSCFCLPPSAWTAVVEAGAPAFIEDVDDVSGVEAWVLASRALDATLSALDAFELVEQYLDTAEVLEVSFHADLGYPTRIDVDVDMLVADDEFTRTFSDVEDLGNRACTEIGCSSGISLVLLPPGRGRFAPGTYAVRALVSYGQEFSCSFRVSNDLAECTSGHCIVDVDCGGIQLVPSFPEEIRVELPLLPIHGVRVLYDDGTDVQIRDEPVSASYERLQPNGPLCPPVCYRLRHEMTLD